MTAKIKESDVPVLPIFDLIQEKGNVPRREMFNTFNMGIGMTVVVSKDEADKALEALKAAGEQPVRLGEIVAGDILCTGEGGFIAPLAFPKDA